MSFTYGGVDVGTLAGVTATLEEWPSLGGLELDTEDLPGHHGRVFHGATRTVSRFEFDVIIEGPTPAETMARRDAFVELLDPSRGLRPLVLHVDPDWEFPGVLVAEEINWSRMAWDYSVGFKLRDTVTLETQEDAAAYRPEPEQVSVNGETTYTLDSGNTSARPRVTVEIPEGSGGEDVTVTIGSFSVTVEGGAAAGELLDLDWDAVEFYRRDSSGRRLGSLVRYMDNYDRPELRKGEPVTVSCSPSDADAVLWPNVRRI